MSIPYFAARTANPPYRQPRNLPDRPRYAGFSPSPNFETRSSSLLPRTIQGGSLSGGYVALVVVGVLGLLTVITVVAFLLYRRNRSTSKASRLYSSRHIQEKSGARTWQRLSRGISGKISLGEDRQSLISHHSRVPSITISRPIAHSTHSGPTPIFGIKEHESLHYSDFSDSSQSSPEAVYDPHTRDRSRSRSHSNSNSIQSSARSRDTSPNIYTSRSRDSSVSSHRSRSHSNTRNSRPLGQNSWSQARARSLSSSSFGRRAPSQASPLPETNEEHIPSTKSSPQEKSLPPPPPKSVTNPHKNSLTYTPSDPKNWHIDPYTTFSQQTSAINIADAEGLQVDDTQVISIAIAAPLDIPEGPLTPFGEREAKAGAALGYKSAWYKSPRNDSGSWLV